MGEKSGENSSAYTVGEIVALRREAEQLQLCGRSKLDSYTPAELQEICNGIGADWMPEIMRELLTALSPFAEAAAMIHDVEYFEGGNASEREAADRRFRENIVRTAKRSYGWYHPLRYLAMVRAECFYLLLRTFGTAAWKEREVTNAEHQ